MYTSAAAKHLLAILSSQSTLLDSIISAQKRIHGAVIGKNWENLQADLAAFDSLSQKFALLENERASFCASSRASQNAQEQLDSESFIDIIALFPREERESLLSAFTNLRKKLFASKIENRGLGEYLKITRDFLQGVFDTAVPNRRNKVYSNTGALINIAPESLVLNTLL
jgi:hypothetical protein